MSNGELLSGTFPTQAAAERAVSELRRLGYVESEIQSSAEGGQVRLLVTPHADTRAQVKDVLEAGGWASQAATDPAPDGAGWRSGEARRANGRHESGEEVTTDHTVSTDWTTGTGNRGHLPGG